MSDMHADFDPVLVRGELYVLARAAFSSDIEAADWMARPHPVLGGRSPHQASETPQGAQQVTDMLMALKFGGAV